MGQRRVLKVLLDTHALVWSLFRDRRLSPVAAQRIDAADKVLVSAVSIYEIDWKRRSQHRRSVDSAFSRMPSDMPAALPLFGFTLVDVTPEAAWIAANLRVAHKDPWDRFLLAQAHLLDVPLISCDAKLREGSLAVRIVW